MDHTVKLFRGEQLRHPLTVGKIQLLEMKCRGCQTIQTSLFQANVIIVIHVVDADNIMPLIQQALRDMKADKTCGTSNQKLHIYPLGVDIPFYIRADFTLACGWDHLLCHDKICK